MHPPASLEPEMWCRILIACSGGALGRFRAQRPRSQRPGRQGRAGQKTAPARPHPHTRRTGSPEDGRAGRRHRGQGPGRGQPGENNRPSPATHARKGRTGRRTMMSATTARPHRESRQARPSRGGRRHGCRSRDLADVPSGNDTAGRRRGLTGSMDAMFDRRREAAAAHDEPAGSCAVAPCARSPHPQTQTAQPGMAARRHASPDSATLRRRHISRCARCPLFSPIGSGPANRRLPCGPSNIRLRPWAAAVVPLWLPSPNGYPHYQ
jgi:hypothetical protein